MTVISENTILSCAYMERLRQGAMLRACVLTGYNGINYFLAIVTMLGLSSLAVMFTLDIINKPTKV